MSRHPALTWGTGVPAHCKGVWGEEREEVRGEGEGVGSWIRRRLLEQEGVTLLPLNSKMTFPGKLS